MDDLIPFLIFSILIDRFLSKIFKINCLRCEDKHECSFNWNMLPQVVPDYPGVKRDYPVHVRDLLAQVVFKCENKRNPSMHYMNALISFNSTIN